MLASLLQQAGYGVVESTNGRDAVLRCRESLPDLVVMDIRMPGMDGYEATSQIKEQFGRRFLPVIVVSGQNDQECHAKALESGADDFLTKPINPALLRAKINVLLRFRTLNNSLQENTNELEQKLASQRKTQQELGELSNQDPLTGLLNRHFFLIYLDQAIESARQSGRHLALLMIDVARFKRVNDVYGHLIGDQVLLEISMRLEKHSEGRFVLSRIGGDHFVMLCENVQSEERLRATVSAVIENCSQPYRVEGDDLMLGLNVGVATFPDQCDNAESFLRCAGTALEFSRQMGNNQHCLFELDMQRQTREYHELDNSIHTALENGELELYYQAQVDSNNRKIVGCEALLRWNHPKLGVISPDIFVPMLEKEKLIDAVGEWVMRESIRQHQAWLQQGLPGVRIAVNFSAVQLQESGLAERVISVIRESGIAPPWFKLEITETAAIGNVEQVARTLKKIRASGIQIAVDDFGTGYSSLNYLQRLPIDIVKIDRQFVKDIPASREDMTLVKAVIAMAHSMGLDVVAEGVETEAQADFLREQLCEELQGYLFSKPLPAADFERLLSDQSQLRLHQTVMFSPEWEASL